MPGAGPILVALAWLLCAVLAWGTFLIARNHLREAESRNVMEGSIDDQVRYGPKK